MKVDRTRKSLGNQLKISPQKNNKHQSSTRCANIYLENHQLYNKYCIPPDWNLAYNHQKSRKTAREIPDDIHVEAVCPCCGFEIERQEIPMCSENMKLDFLGSGFPMFYNYLKYCILLLVTLFVIQGIPNLYLNMKGNFCDKTDKQAIQFNKKMEENPEKYKGQFKACAYNIFNYLSIANSIPKDAKLGSLDQTYKTEQTIISTILILAVMIILIIFRKTQRQIDIVVDGNNYTAGDYTLFVKNIPKNLNCDYKQKLQQLFSNNIIPGYNLEVRKINLVYSCHELEHIEHEIYKVVQKKQNLLKQFNHIDNLTESEQIQIDQLKQQIEQLQLQELSVESKIQYDKSKFTGMAFISYQYQNDKDDVVKYYNPSWVSKFTHFFTKNTSDMVAENNLKFFDNDLEISDAVEPNDILWEFIDSTELQKITARSKSNMQTLTLMGCSFVVIWIINYFQSIITDKYSEEDVEGKVNPYTLYLILSTSFLISFSILMFNKFGLAHFMHHFADHERWGSKTDLNISFGKKLTIALFCNTALMTFAVELLTFNNYYGMGGMIYTESIVFIVNAIMPPMIWAFDPWAIIKNYQRKKELQKPVSFLTQQQANELLEGPEYIMGKRYSDIMKTMWFTFFFCSVLPISSFISTIGMICFYWADKYNLLRIRTVKESINMKLSLEMIELLEMTIIFTTFGNLFFSYQLFHIVDNYQIILFICSICYSIIPMEDFNEWLFPMEKIDEPLSYDEAHLDFDTDYDRENPVTKRQALIEWIKNRELKKNAQLIQSSMVDSQQSSSNFTQEQLEKLQNLTNNSMGLGTNNKLSNNLIQGQTIQTTENFRQSQKKVYHQSSSINQSYQSKAKQSIPNIQIHRLSQQQQNQNPSNTSFNMQNGQQSQQSIQQITLN